MTRKKVVLLIGIVLFIFAMIVTTKIIRERNQLLQDKISHYQKIEEKEKEWIIMNQAKNGAILTYEKKVASANWANPYFANLAASALLEGNPSEKQIKSVKQYLSWYLENINNGKEDPVNGAGTIYDYDIAIDKTGEAKSISKKSYDSVDSYASTFLRAASDYVSMTDDTKWLKDHSSDLQEISNALWRCMNAEGITYAKKDYPIYYLMDNCETNAGLKAIETLQKQGAVFSQGNEAKEYLEKNVECIRKKFWQKGEYIVGLDEDGAVLPVKNQSSLYPKTIAQIYPIAWNIVDKEEQKTKELYQNLCNNWNWEQMDYREQGSSQSYWPVLAYVGALMGDEERVERYVKNYMEVVKEDHGYPIHIDDSAWIIKTCEEMAAFYQNKIFTLF